MSSNAETDFGYRRVPETAKKGMVRAVFDSVAPRYDVMNDLMSLGIHRAWKRDFVAGLDPRPGRTLLDLAGGTGDIAFAWRARGGGPVILSDINASMLAVARGRLKNPLPRAGEGLGEGGEEPRTSAASNALTPTLSRTREREKGRAGGAALSLLVADAEALPLPGGCVDRVSIAFGLRNCTDKAAVLREACRVLRPGGQFHCLEFSRVQVAALEKPYDAWSFRVLPLFGRLVARDADSYVYLAESIRTFPDQETLAAMMREAGLSRVRYRNLTGGIAAIHSGWRL